MNASPSLFRRVSNLRLVFIGLLLANIVLYAIGKFASLGESEAVVLLVFSVATGLAVPVVAYLIADNIGQKNAWFYPIGCFIPLVGLIVAIRLIVGAGKFLKNAA